MTRNIGGSGLRECGGPDWRVLGSERLNEATGRAARGGGGPVGRGMALPGRDADEATAVTRQSGQADTGTTVSENR